MNLAGGGAPQTSRPSSSVSQRTGAGFLAADHVPGLLVSRRRVSRVRIRDQHPREGKMNRMSLKIYDTMLTVPAFYFLCIPCVRYFIIALALVLARY